MALDAAEKQRRYRERRKAGMPPVRYRRSLDHRSKPQRWRDAVETLLTLHADYQEWFDKLPENLLVTTLGEKLQAIAELDLEPLQDIDPPRGYGRD